MIVASYRSNGSKYSLVTVTEGMIDSDMEFALQDGVVVDDAYRNRMVESVKQGLAFRITKSGKRIGVMYNMVVGEEYIGCSIYCKNDPVGMLILMKSMFDVYDSHKIKIMPHEGMIGDFVSMATADSIKQYHALASPLTITKATLVPKGEKMFKYLKIEVL